MSKRNLTKIWAQNSVGGSSKNRWQERSRVLDGYNTPSSAVRALLKREKFQSRIWEPAAGNFRIVNVLLKKGYLVYSSDIYRWHPDTNLKRDFRNCTKLPRGKSHDIITNPPFVRAQDFVETAMRLLKPGGKLALLLRLQFLEGKKRRFLFDKHPPIRVWVFSYRLPRMHQFGYKGPKGSSTICFAWFIWIKGFKGSPKIKWI